MVSTRKHIADGLLWCALCILLAAGVLNHSAVKQYSSASLRYSAPISGRTAYAARQYSAAAQSGAASNSDSPFWPTFWGEREATLESEFISAVVKCIEYSGEASGVWPAAFINGSAPGVLDGSGCAVSDALAWRLWGSSDVVGMSVLVDGEYRVVRGVFKGRQELALVSFRDESTLCNWSAVELSGPADAVRADAESYANASGLGAPDSIIMGGAASIAGVMAALPLLIPSVYLLALIIGHVRNSYPLARKPVFYVCLVVFAAALPPVLGALPASFIPTRWSDFSFWASLAGQASDGLRAFLSAAPAMRDVELRMLMLKQAGIALPAVCCGISVCFRWQMRRAQILPYGVVEK